VPYADGGSVRQIIDEGDSWYRIPEKARQHMFLARVDALLVSTADDRVKARQRLGELLVNVLAALVEIEAD
jgi:hypothetical protein